MLKVPKCPTRNEEEENKNKKDSVLKIVHALQRYPQMENVRIVVFIELSHQKIFFFSRKEKKQMNQSAANFCNDLNLCTQWLINQVIFQSVIP
jgi:hypothetical protein